MRNKVFAAVALAAAFSQVAAGQPGSGPLQRPDPTLVKAYVAAEAIKAEEGKQAKSEAELIRDLDKFLAEAGPLTPELEKRTAEGIREVAAKLHGMGLRILAFHKDYEASHKAMVAAYAQAPAPFRAAGATFRRFAADEPFEEIKHDYVRLAEISDALAARYEKRALALPDEAKEVRETMKFVERTVLYLERHDVLVAAFPDLSAGADRERFLDTLRKYLDGYEALRKSMGTVQEKLKEQAMDPRLRPAGGDAVAAGRPKAPAPPAGPAKPAADPPPPDLAAMLVKFNRK